MFLTYEHWIEKAEAKLARGHALSWGVITTLAEFVGWEDDAASFSLDRQRELVNEARKAVDKLKLAFVKARIIS